MAKGNNIIVTANPMGVFMECTVVGTPKPGTIMTPVPGTAPVNGRFSYEPAGTTATVFMSADGDRIPIAVLLPDQLQGKIATDAYVTGTRGFLYFPEPGDEINVLFMDDGSGTSDDLAIGDLLIVDDGTGKLIKTTGSPQSEPFTCLEAVTDPTADQLVWAMYNGH